MSEGFSVVIPARYGSSRLPGKPLAEIAGRAMILHVVERARRSAAREVIVATDHEAVMELLASHGHRCVMTRRTHHSGSDRVMEVVDGLGWHDEHKVINLQGDEPLVPPSVIDQVASALDATPPAPVATLCERLVDRAAIFDPNIVKVVRRRDEGALYFSRAPIPWAREAFQDADRGADLPLPEHRWLRHIGIYAFRVHALRGFCEAQPGELERIEALEQLRLMEMGLDIRVREAGVPVPAGVDTPDDLARINALHAGEPGEAS